MKPALMTRACMLAIGLMGLSGAALAEDLYGYDLPKRRPDIMKAYQAIMPPEMRKIGWLYKFDGTSDPVVHKLVGREDFLSIWVCKPHDCDNAVAVLARPDASRVVAEVKMPNENEGQGQYFGNPNDAETEALDARLQ
ncbi:MAG: hypothetical protein KGO53_05135 [Alphaproteobacteria bacterium]|nr:hypothetical protein [Alphaproteobacteria bacterium]